MKKLTNLELQGFKSIRHLKDLQLSALNVLIGANGAGKSNLISFFRLLNSMAVSPGELQLYIGKAGGANALLHDGARRTPQIEARLSVQTSAGPSGYQVCLSHAAPDTLIFARERIREFGPWISLGAGHREALLMGRAEGGDPARTVLSLLKSCIVYQFHNTSATARIRGKWNAEDGCSLKEDAANLAAFLYRLRESKRDYYLRIVETIRQIAPFFADFELHPVDDTMLLQWRERGTDVVFGPHQASDGSLRTFALLALLLQPEEDLPSVVILDEPELGLHPYAIHILAGILKSISIHVQVILATQSVALINCFDPEDIIVVDRSGRESTFQRLAPERLKGWLQEYSMAELWEKNVIDGRP